MPKLYQVSPHNYTQKHFINHKKLRIHLVIEITFLNLMNKRNRFILIKVYFYDRKIELKDEFFENQKNIF